MSRSEEKLKKPHSLVILRGLKGISKIRLEHFWRLSMFYLTLKFQKKLMNGFRETVWRTDERTNGRTNERDSLGLIG